MAREEVSTFKSGKHLTQYQKIIDEMRDILQKDPLPEVQTRLNNLRNLVMKDDNFHPKHKEYVLGRIEDFQHFLDVNLIVGLGDIGRELHNNYYTNRWESHWFNKIKSSLKDFFGELF